MVASSESIDFEDEHCDLASFTAVADNVRIVAEDALRMLAQFPQYAQPCLVNYDYAYRNILLDSDTLRVKALIDWDDVHVMPFIVGIDFPEDITQFSIYGLAPDSNYYREGIFPSFPPDEYGEIIGAVDADGKFAGQAEQGNSIDVDQRNQRIRDTMLRETYIRALQSQDGRVSQPDMWEVRRKVLKAHHLLTEGGWMWWSKREWLQMQASGIGEDTVNMNVCR
ncbi:hypothetical protein EW026_g6630 [Hermanssonia centrifuga]|uniref:Aminoglycoside phosphotransferase domain-containing protein n=1 Tax=Hermanssonia centrifuga TaxID=98765 RepID=A0A4V3X9P5_9APHY|nr:hypothetical protein EW026_g6630 [Hermanssonia centrifuga]